MSNWRYKIYVHDELLEYRATNHDDYSVASDYKWRPSIHMPRWASRITLEVKAVRVERLNDITEEDIKAEGISPYPNQSTEYAFVELWDRIHSEDGFGWDMDPYCWVVEFEVIS